MTVEIYGDAEVIGCGKFVPNNFLNNDQIIALHGVDSSSEWVEERTLIKTRAINNNPKHATSDLAAEAGGEALEDAHTKPKDIDMVIVATITPDSPFPSVANLVQHKLGIPTSATAIDINAGCSGFVHGYSLAVQAIESRRARRALVIGAETLSTITNWKDRNTCFLFGDGAGAVVMERSKREITRPIINLGSDGSHPEWLTVPAGGSRHPLDYDALLGNLHTIHMDGKQIYKFAINTMLESMKKTMKEANLQPDDFKIVIPHNANGRMIQEMERKSKLPLFMNVDRYGNTSAASIPIALREALDQELILPGDWVGLVAFGAGRNWGSAAFRWRESLLAKPALSSSLFDRISNPIRRFWTSYPQATLVEIPRVVSTENTRSLQSEA